MFMCGEYLYITHARRGLREDRSEEGDRRVMAQDCACGYVKYGEVFSITYICIDIHIYICIHMCTFILHMH